MKGPLSPLASGSLAPFFGGRGSAVRLVGALPRKKVSSEGGRGATYGGRMGNTPSANTAINSALLRRSAPEMSWSGATKKKVTPTEEWAAPASEASVEAPSSRTSVRPKVPAASVEDIISFGPPSRSAMQNSTSMVGVSGRLLDRLRTAERRRAVDASSPHSLYGPKTPEEEEEEKEALQRLKRRRDSEAAAAAKKKRRAAVESKARELGLSVERRPNSGSEPKPKSRSRRRSSRARPEDKVDRGEDEEFPRDRSRVRAKRAKRPAEHRRKAERILTPIREVPSELAPASSIFQMAIREAVKKENETSARKADRLKAEKPIARKSGELFEYLEDLSGTFFRSLKSQLPNSPMAANDVVVTRDKLAAMEKFRASRLQEAANAGSGSLANSDILGPRPTGRDQAIVELAEKIEEAVTSHDTERLHELLADSASLAALSVRFEDRVALTAAQVGVKEVILGDVHEELKVAQIRLRASKEVTFDKLTPHITELGLKLAIAGGELERARKVHFRAIQFKQIINERFQKTIEQHRNADDVFLAEVINDRLKGTEEEIQEIDVQYATILESHMNELETAQLNEEANEEGLRLHWNHARIASALKDSGFGELAKIVDPREREQLLAQVQRSQDPRPAHPQQPQYEAQSRLVSGPPGITMGFPESGSVPMGIAYVNATPQPSPTEPLTDTQDFDDRGGFYEDSGVAEDSESAQEVLSDAPSSAAEVGFLPA